MPLFYVEVQREIERTFTVLQESMIWVEADSIEAAETAVEKMSHEGDAIDDYCHWRDVEGETNQTSKDEDCVHPTGLRLTDSNPCKPKKDRILRASEILEDEE